MIQLRPAVQGDVNDVRTLRLDGVESLTAVSAIVGHVWQNRGPRVALDAAVVDDVERTVTLSLGGAGGWLASVDPGGYFVELQATFQDGSKLTWPAARPASINVRAEGDPDE